MPRRTRDIGTRSLAWLGLVAIAVGCSGGGGGGGGGELRVVSFEPAGTDGLVYRDQDLVFEFSEPVDPVSVSVAGLQVTRNRQVVPGRIEIDDRVIRWSPVVLPGDRNEYVPDNLPPLNGLGLLANARYDVRMSGGRASSIRSRSGRPLAAEFRSTFSTSDEFEPEEPPVAPSVVLEASPIFNPPPLVDGDPLSSDPADWPILDPRSVGIEIRFSERMNPARVDSFASATVTNVTEIAGESVPAGVGEIALFEARFTPEADVLTLRNVVSLGDLPDSDRPYEFRVELTRQLTDLVGLPLDRPFVFRFRTADFPGEPNHAVFTESFEDTVFRDDAETSANWGDGSLEGADVATRTDTYIPMPQQRFNLPHPLVERNNPLTPRGCRFQMRFDTDHMPALPGESIAGMAWAPRSEFGFQSTYREMTFKIGHFSGLDGGHMQREFDANFNPAPLIVFEGDYVVDFSVGAEWIDWPAFGVDFEYDTSRPLVFEVNIPEGGDTFQLFKNRSNGNFQTYRRFANGNDVTSFTQNENTQYNHRFLLVAKKSIAQSVPIATGIPQNDFAGFLMQIDGERPGTQVRLTWAPSLDGDPPAEFDENINIADLASHIVFRTELVADAFTGVVPRVLSISFAYVVPDR